MNLGFHWNIIMIWKAPRTGSRVSAFDLDLTRLNGSTMTDLHSGIMEEEVNQCSRAVEKVSCRPLAKVGDCFGLTLELRGRRRSYPSFC